MRKTVIAVKRDKQPGQRERRNRGDENRQAAVWVEDLRQDADDFARGLCLGGADGCEMRS